MIFLIAGLFQGKQLLLKTRAEPWTTPWDPLGVECIGFQLYVDQNNRGMVCVCVFLKIFVALGVGSSCS